MPIQRIAVDVRHAPSVFFMAILPESVMLRLKDGTRQRELGDKNVW